MLNNIYFDFEFKCDMFLAIHECYYHATNGKSILSIVLTPVLSPKFWFWIREEATQEATHKIHNTKILFTFYHTVDKTKGLAFRKPEVHSSNCTVVLHIIISYIEILWKLKIHFNSCDDNNNNNNTVGQHQSFMNTSLQPKYDLITDTESNLHHIKYCQINNVNILVQKWPLLISDIVDKYKTPLLK